MKLDTDRNTPVIRFTSRTHRISFTRLITDDGMYPGDSERASLFFIISGNEDLYKMRRHIYDMEEHCIRSCLESGKTDFSSSGYAGAIVHAFRKFRAPLSGGEGILYFASGSI